MALLMCKEAARLISDAYQRPLSLRERIALRVHLCTCQACRNFKGQMHLVTEAARRLWQAPAEQFAGLRLSDKARQRLASVLGQRPPSG